MSTKTIQTTVIACDFNGCELNEGLIKSNKPRVLIKNDWIASVFADDKSTDSVIAPAGDYHRACIRVLSNDNISTLRGE